MLSLDEIKKGLEMTLEDVDWMREMLGNPENQNRNTIIALESHYAFECQTCKPFMGRDGFYKIIKKQIGAGENNETLISDVRTIEGIFLLKDLDFEPGFSSILNYVSEIGYICDHCLVSVYHE